MDSVPRTSAVVEAGDHIEGKVSVASPVHDVAARQSDGAVVVVVFFTDLLAVDTPESDEPLTNQSQIRLCLPREPLEYLDCPFIRLVPVEWIREPYVADELQVLGSQPRA